MPTRLWTYAKAGLEADARCLSDTGHHVNDLPPGDLAMALWAYAKLNYNPGAALLDSLANAALRNVKNLVPVDLSNLVWALAALGRLAAHLSVQQ